MKKAFPFLLVVLAFGILLLVLNLREIDDYEFGTETPPGPGSNVAADDNAFARVFPELKEAKGQTDPIYRGGPVERTAALALLRARTKPEEAEHVFANVSMISSRTLLDKTIAAAMDPSMFHVYLGYSGWTMRQLQGEIQLGAWRIFPGNAAAVFDPDPETLWGRLIRKTEERIALAAEGVIYTNANHRCVVNRHHAARPRAESQKKRSAAGA